MMISSLVDYFITDKLYDAEAEEAVPKTFLCVSAIFFAEKKMLENRSVFVFHSHIFSAF
jgi:hypothetical protein